MSSVSHIDEVQQVSVVIPVYQGERTLEPLLKEIEPLTHPANRGASFQIDDVILVHDGAIDDSARVIQELALKYTFVKPIWLSRNFGQHPATLAGIASTRAPWVVTMDEDGQQNPLDIVRLLSHAQETDAQLVYGIPANVPPHSWLRNMLSFLAKWVFVRLLSNAHVGQFSSFRLIQGEIARGLAAYCGNSIFLDVALSWVIAEADHCPVMLRSEGRHRSGYSLRSLANHFWRLILTAGTKPLRLITSMGLLAILGGTVISIYALWLKITHEMPIQGWTSTVIVVSFFSGCILFALGIIAEYLAVALNIIMGKPLYLTASKPVRKRSMIA